MHSVSTSFTSLHYSLPHTYIDFICFPSDDIRTHVFTYKISSGNSIRKYTYIGKHLIVTQNSHHPFIRITESYYVLVGPLQPRTHTRSIRHACYAIVLCYRSYLMQRKYQMYVFIFQRKRFHRPLIF